MTNDSKKITVDTEGKNLVSDIKKQDFQVAEQGEKNYSTSPHKRIDKLDQELQKRLDKFEERQITDKASLITVFGIFASIVALLSIEIQILKTVCSFWKVVGFSLIILGSLLSFVLILHYIGQSWIKNGQRQKFPWFIGIIITFLFIVGIIFSTQGNENSCIENAIFKRYENNFLEKQIELEKMYADKIQNLQNEIDNNKKAVEEIKNLQNL